MALSADELVRSPAWLPLEMQGMAVRLVNLDEAAYRAASFLDQRLLGGGYAQEACAPGLLETAAARLSPRAHYVFHTGHVGSTLISRLIGAHESFFSLREPALLRALAAPTAASGAPSLPVTLALLARTWRSSQHAVIKVTSFVSELAETILVASAQPSAVFMFARPLPYLQGIFAGDNSRRESRQLSAARLQRLQRRLGAGGSPPDPRSEGECIAMSWLCEMTALRQAAERFASRVLWVDFDAFLREPVTGLRTIFHRLGGRPAEAELETLVSGPLMHQYSKAPEHAYDAALRRELLQSADREHQGEIRRGMDWLQLAAGRHPLAAAVLQ
jgi:hypothetical protein